MNERMRDILIVARSIPIKISLGDRAESYCLEIRSRASVFVLVQQSTSEVFEVRYEHNNGPDAGLVRSHSQYSYRRACGRKRSLLLTLVVLGLERETTVVNGQRSFYRTKVVQEPQSLSLEVSNLEVSQQQERQVGSLNVGEVLLAICSVVVKAQFLQILHKIEII